MSGTVISVQTMAVDQAVNDIMTIYTETDANLDRSIQIMNHSPDMFQGMGANAFGDAYTMLNNAYAEAKDTLRRAAAALGFANENFSQIDQQMAAQYGV